MDLCTDCSPIFSSGPQFLASCNKPTLRFISVAPFGHDHETIREFVSSSGPRSNLPKFIASIIHLTSGTGIYI